MQLSPHFSLAELTRSAAATRLKIDNTPDATQLANLKMLAEVLELIRNILGGNPMLISSGLRVAKLNRAIGGSATSAHERGLAVDFTCPKFGSTYTIARAIRAAVNEGKLDIDQLILEFPPAGWIHVGLRNPMSSNRKQILTARKNSKRQTYYSQGLFKN